VRDQSVNDFRNNMLAHAAMAKVFNLPIVLTSSSDEGPNGLLLKEITEMYPNATFVRRQGEVNAWDNKDFRAAVKATGKKQLIVGGIVTEVCKYNRALATILTGRK
jgi:nicotinamidase-related amidase